MRGMLDAGADLGRSPFDELEAEAPWDEESEDAWDDPTPRVIIGTLASFGTSLPGELASLVDRPVWFLVEERSDEVGVYERWPEGPMEGPRVAAAMSFLRAFCTSHGDELQALLGTAQALRFGFHTTASLEEVVESFEDDGFDVLLGIEDGAVVLPEP